MQCCKDKRIFQVIISPPHLRFSCERRGVVFQMRLPGCVWAPAVNVHGVEAEACCLSMPEEDMKGLSLLDAQPFPLPLSTFSASIIQRRAGSLSPPCRSYPCCIDMGGPCCSLSSLKGKWILLEWWSTFGVVNVARGFWMDRSLLQQV